jgi:hypothetical protein
MTSFTRMVRRPVVATCALAMLCVPAAARAGARIVVVPTDGAGEGFNDPTPVSAVGGNTGTTRGQQRLIAFQFAADRWGAMLDSNVTVFVDARFDSLGANVLGQAGPAGIFANFPSRRGFPGPAFADTWYHSALADKRAGRETNPDCIDSPSPLNCVDIFAQFSSDFNFYLGLDNNHGAQVDLVVVVLHELAHGLGFSNFVNEATGANLAGLTDAYSHFTLDSTSLTGAPVSELATDAERAAALANVDKVVWDGPAVTASVPHVLKFGRPELNITAPSAIADAFRVGTAAFGPALSSPGISNDVVLVDDGVGPGSDGCTPLTPASAAQVAGRIALIDRGVCSFMAKATVAQAAGAVAVLVANNAPGNPPPGLGVDPAIPPSSIVIPSVMITQALGISLKAQLAAAQIVSATVGVDISQRAGADPLDRAQLFATNPAQPGSSISHFDNIAFRNQLMEPAINPDLTHEVIPPFDMSLPQLRDVGWFLDANLDGRPDRRFGFGRCETRTRNRQLSNGAMLADQARVWYRDCAASAGKGKALASCVERVTESAQKAGLITGGQRNAVQRCATGQSDRDDHDGRGRASRDDEADGDDADD